MTDSDETLLKSFANHRDEAAFRDLADRYLGLIFHAALRRTRNRLLAEEISQNILCALATKAPSLAKIPDRLPAWLHRATVYESSKAMRAEASHHRRIQLAHTSESPSETPTWAEAIPHLDAAIDQLPDSDRRVLLLHYFENRSFPGIAKSLGKSTAAIQKQSQRALNKLARLLRSKGVALSATAIATGLTAEFAKAAPVSLIQSTTAALLGGSTTYSTTGLALMFASKSKVLMPLLVLFCIVPLALQQVAVSKAEHQLSTLMPQSASDRMERFSLRESVPSYRGISGNYDVSVLLDESNDLEPGNPITWSGFQWKIGQLDADSLENLIDECTAFPAHRNLKKRLIGELMIALSRIDPARAVQGSLIRKPEIRFDYKGIGVISRAFGVWAKADTDSAWDWYRSKCDATGSSPSPISEWNMEFQAPLLNALVFNRSPKFDEFLSSVPPEDIPDLFEKAVDDESVLLYADPSKKGMDELEAIYLPVLEAHLPKSLHDRLITSLCNPDK